MDTKKLLSRLPPFQGNRNVVTEKQSVGRIMKEIVRAHKDYEKDYDRIAEYFIKADSLATEKLLFDFCKDELDYNIETDQDQTVRSPTAILVLNEMRGVDCKHLASFIGGVLSAINRTGENYFDWYYRFASYSIQDSVPEHVFIVVKDQGTEIWIDPVLESFDQRTPYPIYIQDIKPEEMALTRISGVGRKRVGDLPGYSSTNFGRGPKQVACCTPGEIGAITTVSWQLCTGNILVQLAPSPGTVPVVGWIAIAAGTAVVFLFKIFGSNYSTSTGVRWLVQLYEFYVLGLDTTSDNHVNEANTANAQKWFAYVLGVPMYDRPRFDALRTSVNAYLAFPDCAQVPADIAAQAMQRALALNYGAGMGGWRNSTVAPWLIDTTSTTTGLTTITSTTPSGAIVQQQYQGDPNAVPLAGVGAWIQANPVLAAAVGIGGVFLLTKL